MKKYGLLVLLLTTQILLSITISSILSHKDPSTRHIAGNFEEGVLKNSSIAMDETLLFDEKCFTASLDISFSEVKNIFLIIIVQ